jgi:hypothetical protein
MSTPWQAGNLIETFDPATKGYGWYETPQPGTLDPTKPQASPVILWTKSRISSSLRRTRTGI